VGHSYNTSKAGGIDRRIKVQGWPRQKCETILKKRKKEKEKRVGGMHKW
jgi:hypothetical protein